jgi:hypothetical protein
MDTLAKCFAGITIQWMHIFLAAAVTGTIWILWRLQRAANGIKLEKLILEEDGSPSWSKMAGIGAWFVATYVVIHSELQGRVVEGMVILLILYAAVYTLNRTAVWVLSRIYPGGPTPTPPPVQQDITVSAPSNASVTVQTGQNPP